MRDTTSCWRCSAEYPVSALQCQACCASNANIDIDSAAVEMGDASKIDHDWQFHDDSFDHEFGVEVIRYWQCERCGHTGERNGCEITDRSLDYACQ